MRFVVFWLADVQGEWLFFSRATTKWSRITINLKRSAINLCSAIILMSAVSDSIIRQFAILTMNEAPMSGISLNINSFEKMKWNNATLAKPEKINREQKLVYNNRKLTLFVTFSVMSCMLRMPQGHCQVMKTEKNVERSGAERIKTEKMQFYFIHEKN